MLAAYWDPIGGCWTIGFGHTYGLDKDSQCTPEEAESWLEDDLTHALAAAQRLPEWDHLDTDPRRDAVTELVFNMGAGKWTAFKKTRQAMLTGDWAEAGIELVNSRWATQVGPDRSGRLRRWIETGVY